MFVFRVTLIGPASLTYFRDYENSTTFCIRTKISSVRILCAPVWLGTPSSRPSPRCRGRATA